ncbi:MAG TPA: VOC family protein, partial [Pyrinomonadaceae bacterium]|nr:VOC family protein [Pyrinomonadaceae bacterium]
MHHLEQFLFLNFDNARTYMKKITPFLMFANDAVEAMEFYVKVFPNSEIVGTMPGPDGKPAGGTFTLNGEQFHCFNGGEHFKFSEG